MFCNLVRIQIKKFSASLESLNIAKLDTAIIKALYKGSYMSAHVLLKLLLRKRT